MRFGALALATLVAIDPFGWDRFGPLRWWLVSTIGLGVVAAALLGSPRTRWWPRWVTVGWCLTLLGLGVSTLLSDDRWHALVGTPDRHLGLLTWVLGAGVFWAGGLRSRSALVPSTIAIAAGTAVVGLYTVGELIGVESLDIDFAAGRAGGTFGQPAYLGAAMALCVPIVASAAHGRVGGHRTPMYLASALGVIALLASQARAALVGVAVAIAVVAVVRRHDLDSPRNRTLAALGLATLVVVAVATPLGGRLWALTDVDDGVVAGRVDEWQVGAAALAGADGGGLVGYGPEGYRTVFGAYVDEQYVIDHGREAITDRAHNSVLDAALAGGLVAGVGLAVLHAGLVGVAIRAIGVGSAIEIGLGAGVIAYVVQQLFLFPLAELDPLFWALAGILTVRSTAHLTEGAVHEVPRPLARTTGAVVACVAVGAGLAGALDVVADHRVAAAVEASDTGRAESATDLRPDSIRYAFIASRRAETPGEALALLDDGLDVSPHDPALLTERAAVLLDRARLTDRDDHLDAALDALDELDEIDPLHPESQLRLGVARALAGDADGAIEALTRAAELAPDSTEPLINLAVVLIDERRPAEARAALETASERDPTDPRILPLLDEISAIEGA